ncbi:hypothetical protein V5O48_015265 [Marasmius crinis-equi]|uniref:Osmotin, thaumatin-like protein n=1 Tax=Marasmius crinis-equi TaxID=585013 RepID=A0ABR3EV14_9AGAR
MFNTGMFVLLVAAAMVSASSLNIHNKCTKAVTVQIAIPGGTKPDVTVAPGASAGSAQGIPQSGHGIALNFITDPAQTNVAMSRAEINFTPDNPAGKTFINLSNMFGFSVPIELTGSGCRDYVCNIAPGCPVPGPGGSCVSPCCGALNGCQGASSCPNGKRPGEKGGGPGPHSDFYKNACPNSYAWGEEDSDNPTQDLGSNCSGDDIEITLCTDKPSSKL